MRWFKGAQGAPRVSKVDIGGAKKLLWPRGLIISVTLDATQTFSRSGDLRGYLKVVYGGPAIVGKRYITSLGHKVSEMFPSVLLHRFAKLLL